MAWAGRGAAWLTRATALFLDTTFLSPKYDFPPQDVAVQAAAEIALKEDAARTLILIGTYQIGKEKVLLSVAKALNKKVFVTDEKCVAYISLALVR